MIVKRLLKKGFNGGGVGVGEWIRLGRVRLRLGKKGLIRVIG